MDVTIIIPAYNEERGIGEVIKDVNAHCSSFVKEVIVVDDGSHDNTAGIAREMGARVIRHSHNKGYGASLISGIREADTEFVVTFDADGQHLAKDIVRLWKSVDNNDMVVGHRTGLVPSPFWRMPCKWLLQIVACYLTKRKIPDLNCGLRLMRRKVILKYLHLCPNGFSFSTTITMTMFNRGYNVSYIPIEVKKRVGSSSVSVLTGLETVILILRITTLFNPLRFFIPMSVLIGLTGFFWGLPIVLTARGVSVGALLAILTALLLFSLGLISDQISQLRLERFE